MLCWLLKHLLVSSSYMMWMLYIIRLDYDLLAVAVASWIYFFPFWFSLLHYVSWLLFTYLQSVMFPFWPFRHDWPSVFSLKTHWPHVTRRSASTNQSPDWRAGDQWEAGWWHVMRVAGTWHITFPLPVSGLRACGEWQGRRDTLSTSDNERRYWSGNKTPQILILHLNYSLFILALFCFRKGREDGVEFQYFVVAHKTFNCCVWPSSGYDSIVSGSKC